MKTINPLYREFINTVAIEAKMSAVNISPSSTICDTTDKLANILGLPPVLTYESIVMLNLLSPNPILMSDDLVIREQERLFYQVHNDIELSLYDALSANITIANTVSIDQSNLRKTLIHLEQSLQKSLSLMSSLYTWFDKHAFMRFRKYFSSIQHRSIDWVQYPWPSWASSASIPIIDILMWIEQSSTALSPLSDNVRPILTGNGYSTLSDMRAASSWTEKYGDFYARFSHDPEMRSLLDSIVILLKKFRMNHSASVKKFLPEAYTGIAWSGWVLNVPEYLDRAIGNTHQRISNHSTN